MVKICRQRSRAAPEAKLIAEAYSKEGFRRGLRVSLTRCVCTTNAYLAILQKCHFEGKTNKRTTFCQQGNNKDSTRKQHQSNTEPTSNQQKNNIELTPKQHWKIQ